MGMNISNSGGRRSRRAPMAEINVTPFVDVMLVLLIIFMVTAPLLVAGVPVNLPESSAKPLEQPTEPIEVAIDQDGIIYIDGAPTAQEQLAQNFAAMAQNQANSGEKLQILLRADKTIDYGRVVLVMGELNAAGLNQISLVTTTSSAASSAASPATTPAESTVSGNDSGDSSGGADNNSASVETTDVSVSAGSSSE